MALLSGKLEQTLQDGAKHHRWIGKGIQFIKTNFYRLITSNVCEQGTDVKRAHNLIVMIIYLDPISNAEGILDSGVICTDGLKYAHKI